MEVFLFGIFCFHFFPLAVCIAQLNMHGVSLQMRQNSWESKFWEIHENQNKFALALCIFDHLLYKIHKISGKEDFLQRVVKNLNPSLKFWGKGRISDDASRMGKVLMVANLGSQQGLTWKVWASDQWSVLFLKYISVPVGILCVGLLFAILHISKGQCSSFSSCKL